MTIRQRAIRCACWLLAAGALLVPQAQAAFVTPYALSNFVLTNTNADGTAVTNDGGVSVILTGGNNGSGLNGTTDLTVAAAASGTVHFQFSYFSFDLPGFDAAGYLLDGVFTQLTDTSGDTGTVNFAVLAGHQFGFRIATLDNEGEPGVLTISAFSAPGGTAPVPEPAGWTLGAAAVLVFGIHVWLRPRRAFEVRR
jgi:hypothetical protein